VPHTVTVSVPPSRSLQFQSQKIRSKNNLKFYAYFFSFKKFNRDRKKFLVGAGAALKRCAPTTESATFPDGFQLPVCNMSALVVHKLHFLQLVKISVAKSEPQGAALFREAGAVIRIQDATPAPTAPPPNLMYNKYRFLKMSPIATVSCFFYPYLFFT
jgi:hypothetical protein